jgi:hypothetical protein
MRFFSHAHQQASGIRQRTPASSAYVHVVPFHFRQFSPVAPLILLS